MTNGSRKNSPNYLILDVETTRFPDGNPYSPDRKLHCVSIRDGEGCTSYDIEHGDEPYGDKLLSIQRRIQAASLVIGFNIKFDLTWIRRYVPSIRFPRVFDCQLAEFILSDQQLKYPSLDEVATSRNLGRKLDVVKLEYWDRGIDTAYVPWTTLAEYCEHDVELTYQLFELQAKELEGNKKRLFIKQCEDLLILQEMEWNGLYYNTEEATERGRAIQQEVIEVDAKLSQLADFDGFLWSSPDHRSCLLYGGFYYCDVRVPTERVLKDGTVKRGEKWGLKKVTLPRLVEPPKGTEGKDTKGLKDGDLEYQNKQRIAEGKKEVCRHWSTAEPVLSKLKYTNKKGKQLVELILERQRLLHLDSTYYTGLVTKLERAGYPKDVVHSQFNQCNAVTSRLSCEDPNQQNFDKNIKDLFYTRYEDHSSG